MDLCILGADPIKYVDYCGRIRKEYNIIPDIIYKPSESFETFSGNGKNFQDKTFFSTLRGASEVKYWS
jgi:hypothetical protein